MTIAKRSFGRLHDGTPVDLYTLTNGNGMHATISNYGGKIVALTAPDREGRFADVVLGFDTLEGYLQPNPFFGTIVGRCANRIGDARFTLNGTEYRLTPNEGVHHSHGGERGFDKVFWAAEGTEGASGPQLTLQYDSADGEEGYPGALAVTVRYTLANDNALRIEYDAVPAKDTIVSLTNHSYFNLAGAGVGDIFGHELLIDADSFTPISEERVTTGELRPVANTPMDFRSPTGIGQRSAAPDQQLCWGIGYDHNWVLNSDPAHPTEVIELYEPGSGRLLEVATTAPGVQFYAGNKLERRVVIGKGGKVYKNHAGLCLETQHYPNAVNHPHFPSPIVRAGERYHQVTIYRFSIR
jgi:aldose 1-epimerase